MSSHARHYPALYVDWNSTGCASAKLLGVTFSHNLKLKRCYLLKCLTYPLSPYFLFTLKL